MAEQGRRRILITGIASTLAGRLAARLERDERVAYVAGVDLAQPSHPLTATEFIRADLRNPLVAKVVDSTRVDTIVHLALAARPAAVGGRSRMKELNVIGTMQLLAAAQKSPSVRTLVLKSTTAVYGSHYRDPALFRESHESRTAPRTGYTKDALDVEAYARGFGRRRPDVDLVVLRLANTVGAGVSNPLTSYLRLPVVPTVLGHDPRLQLCHIDDAVEVLVRATLGSHPGTFNVASRGIVYLSQAVRLVGRPTLPIAPPLVGTAAALGRRLAGLDFSMDQLGLLTFGRVGDISRMMAEFGYRPRYTTREALEDLVASGDLTPVVDPGLVRAAERRVGDAALRLAALAGRR